MPEPASRGSVDWFDGLIAEVRNTSGWKIVGLEPSEVDEVAKHAPAGLPESYASFLAVAGRACGALWRGSDVTFPSLLEARARAMALLEETPTPFRLRSDALIIGTHQGYAFDFLTGDGPNPAVFRYTEGDHDSHKLADSFTEFVSDELKRALSAERGEVQSNRELIATIYQTIETMSLASGSDTSGTELALLVADIVDHRDHALPSLIALCEQRSGHEDPTSKIDRMHSRLLTESIRLQTLLSR